jgi:TRAP transporter TAXI family solute receptor
LQGKKPWIAMGQPSESRAKVITKARAIAIAAVVIAVVVASLAYLYLAGIVGAPAPAKKAIRILGGTPGTTAYIGGSLLADVARKALPECEVSFYAVGGSTACTKEFIAGGGEMAFSANSELYALYERKLWYKDIPPEAVKVKPVHTLYFTTTTSIMVTTPELKEKYKLNSWRDLDGKRVVLWSTKYGPYYWMTAALDALGVHVHHVEMDLDLVGDALKKEDVVAVLITHTGGVPVPWVIGMLTKVKAIIIPPSSDEVEAIKKTGLPFAWISTEPFKKAGVDCLGLDKTFGVTYHLAFHTSLTCMTEDEVYRLVKEMVKRKDDLARMSPYFKDFAADPIGMQVEAISLTPGIPVHPGLARLLKEYGAWNEAWRIARE